MGIDIDQKALSTFNANFNDRGKSIDMFTATGKDVTDAAGIERGDVTVLIGCPPCQGYSKLSGEAGKNDPRNILVKKFGEIVEYIQPLFITFENVPGVVDKTGYFEEMIRTVEGCGYQITKQIVDMREYGIPQRRKRMVVVGCRDPKIFAGFRFPEVTHSASGTDGRIRYASVRDAISDLPKISAGGSDPSVHNHSSMGHGQKVTDRIIAIPKDGGSLKDAPEIFRYACHKGDNRGYNDVFGRMKWDCPSPTITTGCYNPTKGRFLHPEQNRAISLREAARLQTFPDDFQFSGGVISVSKQIGNAFPPKYAELLADAIVKAIENDEN